MSFVVSHAARGTTCVDGVATASALCVPVHWHGHPAFPSQHESVASRLAGLWEHGGTGLGTLKNVCDCYTIIRESIHQRNFVYRVTSIYINSFIPLSASATSHEIFASSYETLLE